MVVEPAKVRIAKCGASETAVELDMATRERSQVILPLRLEQGEMLSS